MEFDPEANLERLQRMQRELEAQYKILEALSEHIMIKSAWSIWQAQKLIDRITEQSD
jgi:hypothetical protein